MPFHACPNCGSTISDGVGAQPTACPWCCARLRVDDGLPPPAPLLPPKPRPVVRTPIGSDALAPSAARHALGPLRSQLGDARYRVCELLVSELVTNVVRHTAGDRSIAASDMRVRVYPDRVRIEVRDDGPGLTPPPSARDVDPGGGWGLFLVDELADEWGIESGVQSCVWFELTRTPLPSGVHAAAHH
jgi:anti-sigma regulatory factor (Ser/Thr protein kinase)